VLDAAVIVNDVPLADVTGLNAAVAPAGRPDAEKLTWPLKPLLAVTLMASLPFAPCTTPNVAALAWILKDGVVAGTSAPLHTAYGLVTLPDVVV
jgi:hypothetical protein